MQMSNFSPRRTGIYFLLLVLLVSCSGISFLGSKKNYYTDPFLSQIKTIKSIYRKGDVEVALQKLKMMDDQTMLPTEKALRRNLIGVILFSKKNFEQAIFNFDLALTTSRLDESLTSQIRLNLASSYYKLGFMEKAYTILVLAESNSMKRGELKKYYKLRYKLAKELGKDRDVIISLIKYLSTKKKLAELKGENFFELMIGNFFKLDKREKFQILEE